MAAVAPLLKKGRMSDGAGGVLGGRMTFPSGACPIVYGVNRDCSSIGGNEKRCEQEKRKEGRLRDVRQGRESFLLIGDGTSVP